MEWALALVALVLVVGLGWSRAARQQPEEPHTGVARPRPRAPDPDLPLSADDEQDLERMFAEVDREEAAHLRRLLEVRMGDVIRRQVPVRAIRQAPARSVARICFSNGDVVLATSRRPGDFLHMATAMLRTSVTLAELSPGDQGPALRFTWRGGGTLEVIAVGLDQAD
ncbi:hypothetical protein [Ornithinimicrobium sediminis]|uniref:hypothetical protein n=1 Tax=Ornithinimicrobium sediminis TaxID=2904603 RepID=UPI001E4B0816|nr:hypothetical protein [Ornithinimicrobium sediminis]MCE0487431.1 hypothetical protein [Ornithinimicrobium sediminis]